jgi:hypothetical protein
MAPNAPVWRSGWKEWKPAHDVPELTTSALSAANGIVQNIPPPPLAMVAVQHAFESTSAPPPAVTEEPPPPPAYVPMATKPAPGSGPLPEPASSAPTLELQPLPPPPPVPVDPPSAPPASPPVTSNTIVGVPKISQPPPAQPQLQTLVGITPSKPPPLPPKASTPPPPPAAAKPPPPVNAAPAGVTMSKPPPPVPKKPSMPPPPVPKKSIPPPVPGKAPPPEELSASELLSDGDSTGQLPAADDPTGRLPAADDPTGEMPALQVAAQISEVTLPNRPDPRAEPEPRNVPANTIIGGAPAPPPSVFTSNPISISPMAQTATEVLGPHANVHSPQPPQYQAPPYQAPQSQPHQQSAPQQQMQTMMGGVTPPPGPVIPPAPPAPQFEGLANGGLPVQHPQPSDGVGDSMFPPLQQQSPSNPPENLTSGINTGVSGIVGDLRSAKPKNKFLLPVAGVLVGMIGLVVLAGLVSVVRSCKSGKDDKLAQLTPSALPPGTMVAPTPPPSTLPTPVASQVVAPSDTVRVPAPVSEGSLNAPVFEKCAPEGASVLAAPRALVATGVEVFPKNPGFVLGFATTLTNGTAIPIDANLAPGAPVLVRSALPVKRITPYVSGSQVVAYADADRKGDKLMGRRTVIGSGSPIDVGFNEGSISWTPHGADTFAALFTVGPDGQSVEALRGVPLAMEKGIAVTFRRGGAIWIGIATGDNVLTPKRFSSIAGMSGKVGSPAIAVSGDAVIVAWADRAGPKDPWGIRLARFSPKDAQPVVVDFVPPAGGGGVKAMSPSLAGIGAGKYILAWSEGPARGERIRAVNMSADNAPVGEAAFISPEGQNAGQPQVAIGPDGKGAIAFLGEKGGAFEVRVSGLTCARGTN